MKYNTLCCFITLFFSITTFQSFTQTQEKFPLIQNKNLSNTELLKTNDRNGEVEEEWVAIYNGTGSLSDEATDIAIDSFGNVYVTGYSQGLGYDYDCATIKYNAHGEVQWINIYDGGFDDYAYKLALDDSTNVFITGSSDGSSTGRDCLTIKYNSDGVEQWVKKYNGPGNGDDSSNDIVVDNFGDVYVTGYSTGLDWNKDYVTIKYNNAGIEQWTKRYNGTGNSYDEAVAITIDNLENIFVTGKSIGLYNRYNYLTIKYDVTGVEKWINRYVGAGIYSDLAYDVIVDNSGSAYVTGASHDTNTITSDYLTVKYDSNGVQQWTASYNGTGNSSDLAYVIALDNSNNIYITGYSLGEDGQPDYATVKYYPSGEEQWISRFEHGHVFDLVLDNLGNIYITGVSSDSTTGDYTTIKYDPTGIQKWIIRYNNYGLDIATALAIDEFENVHVTGRIEVPGGIPTYNYATVKYKQRIIPVELTNFTASQIDNSVLLNWQTATEMNNQGFEVQRSKVKSQKSEWEKIGFVQGFGTTTEPRSYSFTDKNVTSGIYKYRLKQIDYEGTFSYSDVVYVELNQVPEEFKLYQNYPNPFNPTTVISYQLPVISNVTLKVYDILGNDVATLVNEEKQPGEYEVEFDASLLASGIYLYQLKTGAFVQTNKMILTK